MLKNFFSKKNKKNTNDYSLVSKELAENAKSIPDDELMNLIYKEMENLTDPISAVKLFVYMNEVVIRYQILLMYSKEISQKAKDILKDNVSDYVEDTGAIRTPTFTKTGGRNDKN